jgi:nucleoside-diphosphate-sugar epimerase
MVYKSDMKVLLTGALGYIGTETLTRFSKRPDITVYAIDNDATAIRNYGAYFLRWPNIKIVNCDVTDMTQLKKLPKVDLVIHLAAKVGYVSSSSQPTVTENINVNGVKNISLLGIPTVFFSTGSVYGKIGKVCDETVNPKPQTVYAQTKYLGEQEIKKIDHVIFRPATAYGLSPKTRHDLLIHDLIQQSITNKKLEIYQPQAMRSFYSVQKLAELIEFTCDNFSAFKNNIYNVGCESGNVTKQSLLEILKSLHDFDYITIDGADADTRDYNVSYNKLKQVWPDYNENFVEKIQPVLEYYKQCSQ